MGFWKPILASAVAVMTCAFGAPAASAQEFLDNDGCLRAFPNSPPPNAAYERTYRVVNRCSDASFRVEYTVSGNGRTRDSYVVISTEWNLSLMRGEEIDITSISSARGA